MTFGDKIRNMTDEQLAEVFINTIDANGGDPNEYVVDLGGYHRLLAFDSGDLTEQLEQEIIED